MNNSFAHYFDLHYGETCLVIGNGPSLQHVSNDFLDAFPSFGSNRIYLKFVPTYYVAVNPLVLAQNWREIQELECEAKFVHEGLDLGDGCYRLHSMQAPMFSYDPPRYVYEGHTVTFVALQLAFFMGFQTVYLIGVDHRYHYDGQPNERRHLQGDDPNHFDPAYFRDMEWHNPDLERSEQAYLMAREAFERNGRRIINLTEDSALEVFEKGTLPDDA